MSYLIGFVITILQISSCTSSAASSMNDFLAVVEHKPRGGVQVFQPCRISQPPLHLVPLVANITVAAVAAMTVIAVDPTSLITTDLAMAVDLTVAVIAVNLTVAVMENPMAGPSPADLAIMVDLTTAITRRAVTIFAVAPTVATLQAFNLNVKTDLADMALMTVDRPILQKSVDPSIEANFTMVDFRPIALATPSCH